VGSGGDVAKVSLCRDRRQIGPRDCHQPPQHAEEQEVVAPMIDEALLWMTKLEHGVAGERTEGALTRHQP
jgi:hypothetical protein